MDKNNPLENSIISFLQANCTNRLNHRFTVVGNHTLLACETDTQAGIVDLTEDYACVFHTEPVYTGSTKDVAEKFAAAGGKTYREMMINGGQPLATLLTLSTGIPVNATAHAELQQAVAGMASYGNTFGVPVAGGDVFLNQSESTETTANLLTIGLIDKETQLVSSCHGEDNPVYLVGAPETNQNQISSNAYTNRLLYELICDLHHEDAIVGIKNLDHDGGIAVACADLVANGANGIELNVAFLDGEDKLFEPIPNKFIIILKAVYGKLLEKACRKWNMRCMQIGVVTDKHSLTVMKDQAALVDLPATLLATFYGALPENDIETIPATVPAESADVPIPDEHKNVAKFMLTCPNLLSQQWIFEQFDSTIGTNNLSTNFISDAPVLQIKGARHALAVSFCQSVADIIKSPESVNLLVAESLRRTVCSGGTPAALTGCLQYSGSIGDDILHAINDHIAFFCKKLGISSSGFYMNCVSEKGKPVIKNLSAGTIAFLNDKHQQMTMSFKEKGNMIYMLGKSSNNLNSSEYIHNFHNVKDTPPQAIDLDDEVNLLTVAQRLIARKLVKSAHSVSKGGLFMALLESAMVRSFGFDITVDEEIRKDAFLFGESPSRIVVSVAMARETDFIDFMMKAAVPFMTLGHVTREEIRIDDNSYGFISDYRKNYHGTAAK